MSSEKFEDHEDEFRSYFEELQKIVNNKLSRLNGEQKKKEIRNAEKLLEDADVELAQMTDEAQAAPGTYRTNLMSKTRGYRAKLDKVRKELAKKKAVSTVSGTVGERDNLMVSSGTPFETTQHNKMIEGLESLDRGSQSVVRSQRIAAETDEIGVQIIGDLDDQRESLIRTKDRLKQTDADLGRSRRILNSMGIRLATNKLLLVIIIIVEIAILGTVVYLRFFKKKKK